MAENYLAISSLIPIPFLHHAGQKALYEKVVHLEDLLEMQYLQEPVSEIIISSIVITLFLCVRYRAFDNLPFNIVSSTEHQRWWFVSNYDLKPLQMISCIG